MAAQAADGGDGVNVGSGGDDNTRTQLRSLDTHKQDGLRTYAAAVDRSKESILAALKPLLEPLPSGSLVLEVASGTGQHAAWFAAGLPNVIWQPTEQDGSSAPSIKAWTEDLPNVRPPAVLDAAAAPEDWPVTAGSCAAVYCANVSHISPW